MRIWEIKTMAKIVVWQMYEDYYDYFYWFCDSANSKVYELKQVFELFPNMK